MGLKEHLRKTLVQTRQFTLELLSTFQKPEEWVFQVHPHANHAMWFIGHVSTSDNFFIRMLDATQVRDKPEFTDKFGTGSEPAGDVAAYPPADEVLAYMAERRAKLLELLDRMSEDDLRTKTPPGTPPFLQDFAAVFNMAAWHESMHAGQLTVARRALGHPQVMGGPS